MILDRIRYTIADALYRVGAVALALYTRAKHRALSALPDLTPNEWAGIFALSLIVFGVALGAIVVWNLFGLMGAAAMAGICFGFWLCWQVTRPSEPMNWRAAGQVAVGFVLGALLVAQAFLAGRTHP